jgi:hypothetical protein
MGIRKKAGAMDVNNDRDRSGGSVGMSTSMMEWAKEALAGRTGEMDDEGD